MWMRADGASNEEIRENLSMDLTQVRLIAATPLSATEVHAAEADPTPSDELIPDVLTVPRTPRWLIPPGSLHYVDPVALAELRRLSEAATVGPLRVHVSRRAVEPNEGLVSVHGADCLIYTADLSAETGAETHARQIADARLFVAAVRYVREVVLAESPAS